MFQHLLHDTLLIEQYSTNIYVILGDFAMSLHLINGHYFSLLLLLLNQL